MGGMPHNPETPWPGLASAEAAARLASEGYNELPEAERRTLLRIIGVVVKAQDGQSEVEVEIATGVKVKVLRETITAVLGEPTPANDTKPTKA